MATVDGGTQVAKGHYVVPADVAVLELQGVKQLEKAVKKDSLPPALATFLQERTGSLALFEKLVNAIVQDKTTRNAMGQWKDDQIVSILDTMKGDFASKHVWVALCKRKSSSGTFRWFEFIPIIDGSSTNKKYVPQYDVSNMSGQVIKTMYNKLEFPNGVAVEELKRWGGNKAQKLIEEMPIQVEKIIKDKDLMVEYEALVNECADAGLNKTFNHWQINKLEQIVEAHTPLFEKKGVAVFVGQKQEYVSHGQGGHMEIFRWLEFVDREQQPNYYPQRDAKTKQGKCVIQ